MQCQVTAHPKKINPVGHLAVTKTRLAAMFERRIISQSVSPGTVHFFVIGCLTLCSHFLSDVYLDKTNWQKVCVCGFECLNTQHRLKTYLREKEGEADTDSETVPVSSTLSSSQQFGEDGPISAGFSRCEVGWGSGIRTRTTHEVGNTSRFSWSFYSGCEDK